MGSLIVAILSMYFYSKWCLLVLFNLVFGIGDMSTRGLIRCGRGN